MENREIWHRIYRLAEEIHRLEPWRYLEETDLFGVKSPETGKTYFVSIMGSTGVIESIDEAVERIFKSLQESK